jgi:hypothetical protein
MTDAPGLRRSGRNRKSIVQNDATEEVDAFLETENAVEEAPEEDFLLASDSE